MELIWMHEESKELIHDWNSVEVEPMFGLRNWCSKPRSLRVQPGREGWLDIILTQTSLSLQTLERSKMSDILLARVVAVWKSDSLIVVIFITGGGLMFNVFVMWLVEMLFVFLFVCESMINKIIIINLITETVKGTTLTL
jgi:hypothetical protein